MLCFLVLQSVGGVSDNVYFAGIIKEKKVEEEDDYHETKSRTVRSSVNDDSDSE